MRAFLIAAGVLVGGLVSAQNDRLIFEVASVKPNNSGTTIANGGGIARNRRHLRWAPQPPTGARDAASPEIGPSIFTALEEQLGLKLQSAHAPIEVLVIDSIELPTRD